MSKTILLVDDSPTIRSIVKIYLMGVSFEFLEADRGDTAWDLLEKNSVHLVIADIHMPGMDGVSFVRKIRTSKSPMIRNVPVILLTAEKNEEIRQQGRDAGANEFVLKPVTSNNLRQAIQQFLPFNPA